jgi:microcompartment protein CcmL/EutN
MREAIAVIEMTSVGVGYLVQDAMLKAADVELILGRTICSGKYITVVSGDAAGADASLRAGLDAATDGVVDDLLVTNVHPTVFPALGQSVEIGKDEIGAMGIVETFSATSALAGADAAAKASSIVLFRIHLAMALGGKGYLLMTGTVADVRAGVDAAVAEVRKRGLLVSEVVIPGPRPEMFGEYI